MTGRTPEVEMTTFMYWSLGLVLALLVGAALYDYRRTGEPAGHFPRQRRNPTNGPPSVRTVWNRLTCRTWRPGRSHPPGMSFPLTQAGSAAADHTRGGRAGVTPAVDAQRRGSGWRRP